MKYTVVYVAVVALLAALIGLRKSSQLRCA